MLEIQGASVWLPHVGQVLDDITLAVASGQVCAVVGSTGSGASMVTRLLLGNLPGGARVRGGFRIAGTVLAISDVDLPPVTVAEYLGLDSPDVPAAAAAVGLAEQLPRPVDSLPPDLRTSLHLARLRNAPPTDWVILDTTLRSASGELRRRIVDAVRRRAHEGAGILWADHDLDSLWQVADRFVELHHGRIRQDQSVSTWQPHTVAEPTLMTLARLLELPVEACRTAEDARRLLTSQRFDTPNLVPPRRGTTTSAASHTVAAATLGLRGDDLVIRDSECIALVCRSGRAEPFARALIEDLAGSVASSQRPGGSPARRWAREWEHAHQLMPGHILRTARLEPGMRSLAHHASGEWARLRVAQATSPGRAVWFPHPQVGLDARGVHALAGTLAGSNPAPRVVTGRDIEFMIRACHSVVIIEAGEVVATGTPRAVADLLPESPLVAQVTGNAGMQRLTDLIDSMELS